MSGVTRLCILKKALAINRILLNVFNLENNKEIDEKKTTIEEIKTKIKNEENKNIVKNN